MSGETPRGPWGSSPPQEGGAESQASARRTGARMGSAVAAGGAYGGQLAKCPDTLCPQTPTLATVLSGVENPPARQHYGSHTAPGNNGLVISGG